MATGSAKHPHQIVLEDQVVGPHNKVKDNGDKLYWKFGERHLAGTVQGRE